MCYRFLFTAHEAIPCYAGDFYDNKLGLEQAEAAAAVFAVSGFRHKGRIPEVLNNDIRRE